MTETTALNPQQIAKKGEEIYATRLKSVLEPDAAGKFAAIDVVSGDSSKLWKRRKRNILNGFFILSVSDMKVYSAWADSLPTFMDGKLSSKESPRVGVEIGGVFGKYQRFDAILDTGFTGGVSMPLAQALPLGLVLYSIATFVLADGSKEKTFLCLGSARIDEKEAQVMVALSQGDDVLIGTEFLAMFRTVMHLDYKENVFSLKT
jgi:predicted aspartyl protease